MTTNPDPTMRFFHGARITNTPDRHVSFGPDGSTWGDGPVLEWDPPRRLVHEWRSLYDPELAAEDPSLVTWDIEPQDGGLCLVTVTHDRLDGAPGTAKSVSGPGWMLVLSGLRPSSRPEPHSSTPSTGPFPPHASVRWVTRQEPFPRR